MARVPPPAAHIQHPLTGFEGGELDKGARIRVRLARSKVLGALVPEAGVIGVAARFLQRLPLLVPTVVMSVGVAGTPGRPRWALSGYPRGLSAGGVRGAGCMRSR